ncbi:hypothetical protein CAI16_12410 [Virgibacillus dokdonensis]|uniref:Peptidase M3A/M3B catalytic domain-containing protein n=1 Tax=Virgibacillus dokdonensis TaxID=302167 RepID=A0A3E0WQB5_9BACI|nr:hypothetical protein [Virgibacillus dokdonensis]RFA34186.1 hypothetical protein CAI16_12410 [Virgibacillus dokdonensis]
MTLKLQSLSKEIEFYAEEITQAMYKSFIGEAKADEYTNVLNQFSHFFNWDVISALRNVKWQKDDDNSRALFMLRGYVIGQWYSYNSKILMDEITQAQVQKNILFSREQISLREARNLLKNDKDDELEQLRKKVKLKIKETINPLVFKYYKELKKLSGELEYNNFIEAANDIRRYSLQNLVNESEKYIEASDSIYNLSVESYCYKDGYNFSKINQLDLFSVRRGIDDIRYLVKQLGLKTDGIEVAWINSKQKFSNSFCVPMQIPGRIILITSNTDGFNAQRHFYHEFGHGLHFMNTDPNIKYEFRRMGDHAVAEAYSALMESLLFNKSWLLERGYSSDVALQAYYHRIYLIRKYWAKIKSEVETHLNNQYDESSISNFNKWYSRALNDKYDSTWWTFSLDDELNAASQIRAWLLSAQVNEYLVGRFGKKWFNNSAAGCFLKELYSYGYKYNADEISKILGYNNLDANALIKELKLFQKFEGE